MANLFIGMPVHNGAPFLRQALAGLVGQTYTDFEIFIRDNASTDGTQEIIREFMAKDARITSERHEVLIPAQDNFLKVLKRVNAPYFMLAAYDDRHAPTFVEKIMRVLEEHKDVVGGFCHQQTENYATGSIENGYRLDMSVGNTLFMNAAHFFEAPTSTAVYGIYRTDVLDIVARCFSEPFDWSDVCTIYRIFSRGNFVIYPEVLFTSGIVSAVRRHLSFKKSRLFGSHQFEYLPLLVKGIDAIFNIKRISLAQKTYLVYRHLVFVTSVFLYFEKRSPRALRGIVRCIRILLTVPERLRSLRDGA